MVCKLTLAIQSAKLTMVLARSPGLQPVHYVFEMLSCINGFQKVRYGLGMRFRLAWRSPTGTAALGACTCLYTITAVTVFQLLVYILRNIWQQRKANNASFFIFRACATRKILHLIEKWDVFKILFRIKQAVRYIEYTRVEEHTMHIMK